MLGYQVQRASGLTDTVTAQGGTGLRWRSGHGCRPVGGQRRGLGPATHYPWLSHHVWSPGVWGGCRGRRLHGEQAAPWPSTSSFGPPLTSCLWAPKMTWSAEELRAPDGVPYMGSVTGMAVGESLYGVRSADDYPVGFGSSMVSGRLGPRSRGLTGYRTCSGHRGVRV